MEVSDPEAAAAPFYSNARLKVVSFPAVQIGAVLELKVPDRPLPGPGTSGRRTPSWAKAFRRLRAGPGKPP